MKKMYKFALVLMLLVVVSCNAQKVNAEKSGKQVQTTKQKSSPEKKKKQATSKKTKTTAKKKTPKAHTPPQKKAEKANLLPTTPYKTSVVATYYHDKFNGRKTANGTVFDNSKQTAAHRTLPFGTKLKVINRANGKWIYVTVNDRGPVKTTREIDLTKRAFMDITDDKNKGELVVDIEIVE